MRKRALIVKMGAIGDVVMTLPAARVLYEQGFDIHWICGSVVQPLLACYPWITLIPVDDRAILIGTPFQCAKNIVGLWSRLAFTRYDLCATLNYDWRYRILTLPIRARRKLALSERSRDTALIPGRSYTDEFARLLLGFEDGCRERSLQPLAPDNLPPSPLPAKTAPRRVAIVPGGAANFHMRLTLRRWPVEMYAALANEFQGRNWEIVLLGGSEDDWVRPLFQHLEVTDCLGKLSLPEVISTCNTCDAVISHDTGPMHLAGLSQACLVGIFGPTNPGNFLPRRPGVAGIWGGQGFACRPCHDGHSFAPCHFAGCMHQVTPDMVIRELDHLLEARSTGISEPWRLVFPVPPCDARGQEHYEIRRPVNPTQP
jgi:heptosyltransferase-2